MLYSEIIAVCSQIHTKHVNTLCGQNVEFVNVKPGGTYSYHWAVKGCLTQWNAGLRHLCSNTKQISLALPTRSSVLKMHLSRCLFWIRPKASHRDVAEGSSHRTYDAVSLGEWLPQRRKFRLSVTVTSQMTWISSDLLPGASAEVSDRTCPMWL
jgi:hypothetical protein